jgi:hypothetical protein
MASAKMHYTFPQTSDVDFLLAQSCVTYIQSQKCLLIWVGESVQHWSATHSTAQPITSLGYYSPVAVTMDIIKSQTENMHDFFIYL